MHTVKVTTIGDSIGIVFPKAIVERLNIKDGDYFQIEPASTGCKLILCDAEFTRQLKVAEQIADDRQTVLSKLAE